jgi:hypothetical protein
MFNQRRGDCVIQFDDLKMQWHPRRIFLRVRILGNVGLKAHRGGWYVIEDDKHMFCGLKRYPTNRRILEFEGSHTLCYLPLYTVILLCLDLYYF